MNHSEQSDSSQLQLREVHLSQKRIYKEICLLSVCKADNFTAAVSKMSTECRSLNFSTSLWASMACYGDSFTFYTQTMFASHRKHIYRPPWPIMGITSLFYV
jgi:hypothetical protein